MLNCKVRCVEGSGFFTAGKIYSIFNDEITGDDGDSYDADEGTIEEMNDSFLAKFILVEEQQEQPTPTNPIKDSGNRTEFSTGAVRDMHSGKGRCDLLPACAIIRLAQHFENGCLKYGDRNWENGIPIHSFIDSALRHLMKYLDGATDEDHLCAAAWNCTCAMWTEEKHPELQDIPSRTPSDEI